jgi:hypothetical protein
MEVPMGIQGRGYNRSKSMAHIIELPVERGRLRPDKMRPQERAVWHSIVDAMPSGYFGPENAHLLKMLCSHVVTAEVVAAELAAARDADDMEKVGTLSAIHARTSLTIGNLSTRLKLTPKSRYSQEQASHRVRLNSSTRPWDMKS